MDEVVVTAVEAIAGRDWDLVRSHLHPYLHWEDGSTRLRGRTNVIEMLKTAPPPEMPTWYELRDGQIYRWRA